MGQKRQILKKVLKKQEVLKQEILKEEIYGRKHEKQVSGDLACLDIPDLMSETLVPTEGLEPPHPKAHGPEP
ncbi:MAG: hypothetical protein V4695_04435, partial [Pseudomonadota bacterium]